MLHEILRVRINHAQKLLETTMLSVTDIAVQSGFASLNHFFRVFHGRTGVTPRAFRKLSLSVSMSGSDTKKHMPFTSQRIP
jgi:transcriptional regulator GlxA family with amidase domain